MSACHEPKTTLEAIAKINARSQESFKDLMSNGVEKSVLDQFESFLAAPGTLDPSSLIIRCQVADERFSFRMVTDKPISRWRLTEVFLPFIKRALHRVHGRPDFFVLLSDTVYVSKRSQAEYIDFLKRVPFLRCDWRDDDEISSHAIMIPDYLMLKSKYAEELSAINEACDANPFERRLEVIKWRGRLSGPDYPNLENIQEFPRYSLLMMSLKHPEFIDARLWTYDHVSSCESGVALRRQLQDMFGDPAEFLPPESFAPFKYLISIDGVTSRWGCVPTILASGSVLLLQHQWKQFFYPGLEAWVHYVPLKRDISDLVEQYKWLIDHPVQAKTIAENGQLFAKEILNPEALETFLVDVINKCSDCMVSERS
jgi:hypothetical protein